MATDDLATKQPEDALEETITRIQEQREDWTLDNQELPDDAARFFEYLELTYKQGQNNPASRLNKLEPLQYLHALSVYLGLRSFLRLTALLHRQSVEFGRQGIVEKFPESHRSVLEQRFQIALTASVFRNLYGPVRREIINYLLEN